MFLIKSFRHAFEGIWFCIKHERNFRIHLFAAATVFIIMPYFSLAEQEKILITIAVFLMLALEMINTAFEVLVNFISPEYNINAKHIKDLSAGAVAMMAFGCLCVGTFVFWKPEALWAMLVDITGDVFKAMYAVVYIISGIMFIYL